MSKIVAFSFVILFSLSGVCQVGKSKKFIEKKFQKNRPFIQIDLIESNDDHLLYSINSTTIGGVYYYMFGFVPGNNKCQWQARIMPLGWEENKVSDFNRNHHKVKEVENRWIDHKEKFLFSIHQEPKDSLAIIGTSLYKGNYEANFIRTEVMQKAKYFDLYPKIDHEPQMVFVTDSYEGNNERNKIYQNMIFALRLYNNGYYDFCRYYNAEMDAPHVDRDLGYYDIVDGKIILKPKGTKHINFLLKSDHLVDSSGVYEVKRRKKKGEKVMYRTYEKEYLTNWNYHPVAKKHMSCIGCCDLKPDIRRNNIGDINYAINYFNPRCHAKRFFTSFVEKYSTSYIRLIEEGYCERDGCYYTYHRKDKESEREYKRWDQDTSRESLLGEIGTAIHESSHKMTSVLSEIIYYRKGYFVDSMEYLTMGFYIDNNIDIIVPFDTVFHTNLIDTLIPNWYQDSIFRFSNYVGDESKNASSNGYGIYGLMNEYTAYYHDSRASYDIFSYCINEGCNLTFEEIAIDVHGEIMAYYEFSLFIKWYLQYAQKYEPQIYKRTMENTNLRIAYTLITKQYQKLIQDFNMQIKDHHLTELIRERKKNRPVFRMYEKEDLSLLEKFEMKAVNKQNYLKHLD